MNCSSRRLIFFALMKVEEGRTDCNAVTDADTVEVVALTFRDTPATGNFEA